MDVTVVRTAGFGLSAFCLGIAVQLVAAPEHIYDRIFDLFNTGAVVAAVAYGVLLIIGPDSRLGRITASVVLTLYPVMIWFHELPNSWKVGVPVAALILFFGIVLCGYWLALFDPVPNRSMTDGTSTRTTRPANQSLTTVVAPILSAAGGLLGAIGIEDPRLQVAVFLFGTLGIFGVIGTVRLKLPAS